MDREIVSGCTCIIIEPDIQESVDRTTIVVGEFIPAGTVFSTNRGKKLYSGLDQWSMDARLYALNTNDYIQCIGEKFLMRIDGGEESEQDLEREIDKPKQTETT